MKYFCSVSSRLGSCYHEFYKGRWDGRTFWKSDSILIHDDTFYDLKLYQAFAEVLAGYDPHGVTQISPSQWEAIFDCARQLNTEARAALDEITDWVKDAFEHEAVFTILGI